MIIITFGNAWSFGENSFINFIVIVIDFTVPYSNIFLFIVIPNHNERNCDCALARYFKSIMLIRTIKYLEHFSLVVCTILVIYKFVQTGSIFNLVVFEKRKICICKRNFLALFIKYFYLGESNETNWSPIRNQIY